MNERILILRLSSMGDILLSTPFIRQVRTAFPKAQIDFVIKEQFKDILQTNPHINQIYFVKPEKGVLGLLKLRKHLMSKRYTHIFDLHNNMRTRLLTFFLKPKIRGRIKKDKFKRFLLVYFKLNLYTKITPVSIRYLNVAREAGVTDDGYGLEMFWRDFYEKQVNNHYPQLTQAGSFIAIAPGATAYTKRWPLEHYSRLIGELIQKGERIVLLGGKENIEEFSGLARTERVINLTGETTILDAAIIINRAKAVLSNDSGLMHMAAAVNTPVLAIFGSTVKELGFFPWRSKSIVLQNKNAKCRPCSHVGKKKCPKKHFKCMVEITPQMVLRRLKELL